jgi:hypothetical protein
MGLILILWAVAIVLKGIKEEDTKERKQRVE